MGDFWKTFLFTSLICSSYAKFIIDPGCGLCPKECFCQSSHLMDLSLARWIEMVESGKSSRENDILNENEATFEGHTDSIENPFIKYAMCNLLPSTNPKEFIMSLPNDLKALIIYYNGFGKNITVTTSELSTLSELSILELRGSNTMDFKLEIDAPLPDIHYANFEGVELLGSEYLPRRTYHIDPSENFKYVPFSEQVEYNVSLEISEEVEIVPYEVYMLELQKSKMISFYGWEHLKVLRIHDCKLDELQWEIFDGLNNLRHLSLEHNEIKEIPPFAFYGAMKIKTLSLARNDILDLHYRALAGLFDLENLDLSYNNMTKLSELTFPPLPKLKKIDLRQNPIKYIFSHTFDVMNGTEKMFIGSKTVPILTKTENPFNSLLALTKLNILNFSIPVLDQPIFKGLKNLEQLKIEGSVKIVEFDAFSEMPKVKEIILSNLKIEEISMDAFFGVKFLEIVDISSNKLTELPAGLFDRHPNLREIYLQNNYLTHLPTDFFREIGSVKLVKLTENPWVCNCEMLKWKPGVTNMIRKMKKQKMCVKSRDFKNVHCNEGQLKAEYIYDNRMSPRCNGGPEKVMNKAVYYAVKRDLMCRPKPEPKDPKKEAKENKYYNYQMNLLTKNKFDRQYKGHVEANEHMDAFKMKQQRLRAKYMNSKLQKTMQKQNTNSLVYQYHKGTKNGNDIDFDNDNSNNL